MKIISLFLSFIFVNVKHLYLYLCMVNKQTNDMIFKTGLEYGNDLTIKVLSRTAKTVTIETIAWGVNRIKVRTNPNGLEFISFKAWLINATDLLDIEVSKQIAHEKAYY